MIHAGYPPQRQANHGRQERPDHGEDSRLGSDVHPPPGYLAVAPTTAAAISTAPS